MERLTDSEILARLIYRAYVSPGYAPASMSDKDALVPFQAALDLHARLRLRDQETQEILAAADALPLQPPDVPVSEPDTPADDAALEALGVEQPQFTGYASAEKKEIFARLHAFCATHGLGARKMIADASAGALTISELLDMMSSARVQLAKWRAAAAAMDRIEEKENGS